MINKIIIISSPSGAGKTTLVDVLLGLLEPQEGLISYNGEPMDDSLSEWRSQVAYLPQQVLIIDDLIATGGTAEAGAKLVEKAGGTVSGFVFVINLFDLGGKKLLENKNYKTFSLMDFPGH